MLALCRKSCIDLQRQHALLRWMEEVPALGAQEQYGLQIPSE